jgi:fumarylpyruvate hydrolase
MSTKSTSQFVFDPQTIPSLPVVGKKERVASSYSSSSSNWLFPIHRVYCVGKNYADHIQEMGGDVTRSTPVFFMKPSDGVVFARRTCTSKYNDDQQPQKSDGCISDSRQPISTPIAYPPNTHNLHYEVELVVAIGKKGHHDIAPEQAVDYIYGYAVGIDLTRRDLQSTAKDHRGPWDIAKYFDQSAPMGSISTGIPLEMVQTATITLEVNGTLRQSASLNQMIWSVPEIIAELSKSWILQPGDLIMTGTPEGVGPIQVGDRVVGRVVTEEQNEKVVLLEEVDITVVR